MARRRLIKPKCTLPPVGADEAAIGRYIAAVNAAVLKRDLDPRTADTLIRGADTTRKALAQIDERKKLEKWAVLIARAEVVQRTAMAEAEATRNHITEGEDAETQLDELGATKPTVRPGGTSQADPP